VIVDDEPAARDVIRTLLAPHACIALVAEASNGVEGVQVVRRERPDLVFLDVQMPDLDGFGMLEALGDAVPRGVVFVTAHDEHAIRAFEVHALDYLLKPFGRPRFDAAVQRTMERLDALDALTLRRTLSSMADDREFSAAPGELSLDPSPAVDAAPPIRRIGVRTGTRTVIVDVGDIDWVEAVGDYARIHVGTRTHLVSQRMHALETVLEANQFVRIHRSIIVNVSRVHELHRESDGGGTLVLRGGVRLRVARGRWDTLRSALGMQEFQ
jgi:two-component system LytT family response regulator